MTDTPRLKRRRHTAQMAEFLRIRRRLGYSMLALASITVIGVIGYAIIGRGEHSLLDAIYMTVITLTTVGYGEIIDMSHHPEGRMFTVGLLVVGIGIVAYTVPTLAAFLIEGQLLHFFARRRMDRDIGRMSGHCIVCGDSAAAWHVADELTRSSRQIVVVAPTETALAGAYDRLGDVARVTGDPSDDTVLLEAGVERATGLVACMENDKDNILIALTARRLAPGIRIVGSTESPGTEAKLRTAGADGVVSPSRIGGSRMASELLRPAVVSFLDQVLREPGTSLRIEEVQVPDESAAIGRTVGWLGINDLEGALLLAVRDPHNGHFVFKPDPEMTLEQGTVLVAMVDARGRARIEQRLRTGRHSTFMQQMP